MKPKVISFLDPKIIKMLGLQYEGKVPIYIGDSNETHIKKSHPEDYNKYFSMINTIIEEPDYIAINPSDNSIELVKEFKYDDDFVKVAIRISSYNKLYVRSLYTLNKKRVLNFIKKGNLIPYSKM